MTIFKPQQQTVTETEHKELLLDSYVTYIYRNYCSNCGGVETFAHCFEVWLHPTKTRNSNLRDLRPIVGALKPLKMTVLNAPEKQIPICHECAGRYRVAGRPELVTVQSTNDQWQETLRRKYAPAPSEPKVATKSSASPRIIPRLDEI
jgi:hypothetical protein